MEFRKHKNNKTKLYGFLTFKLNIFNNNNLTGNKLNKKHLKPFDFDVITELGD